MTIPELRFEVSLTIDTESQEALDDLVTKWRGEEPFPLVQAIPTRKTDPGGWLAFDPTAETR